MKQIIFLATAIVAMVACTKGIEPQNSSKEVTFSTPVIAPSTKAVINGTTYASTDGSFGVYSIYTPAGSDLVSAANWADAGNKTFMSNVEVSYADNIKNTLGGWKPATAYFWPVSGKLSFLAYRPYAASGNSVAGGFLKFTDYLVNMNAEPVDLLYSSLIMNQTANAEVNGYYGVDVPFHHALSQITFNAKTKSNYLTGTDTDANNVKITLTSIKLTAKNTSTGTQSADATIGWTAATYSQQSREIVIPAAGIELTKDYIEAGNIATSFNELIAMPQDFTADNDVVFEIKYKIHYTGLTATADEKTETIKLNTLTFSDSSKAFAPNKKYIFNIIIGLEEISFAPKVVDWEVTTVNSDVEIDS